MMNIATQTEFIGMAKDVVNNQDETGLGDETAWRERERECVSGMRLGRICRHHQGLQS